MAEDPLSGLSNINIDNIYELGSIIGKIKIDLFESKDNAEKFRLATEDHSSFARSLATEFTKSKNFLEDSLNLANRLGTSYVKIDDVTKQSKRNLSMGDEIKKQIERTQELFKAQDKRKSLTKAIQSFENGINTLSGQALEKHIKSADKYVVQLHTLGKILNSVDQVDKILQHLANNVESANDQFDKSNIKASALKRVMSSIASIPIIGPLLDWQRMSDKMFGPNGSVKKGIAEMGSQFLKLAKEPLVGFLAIAAVISNLVKSVMEMDKTITSVSNNLGFSKEITQGIFQNFAKTSLEGKKFSDSLDGAFLSIGNMAKATMEMQESLGTSALFTQDMVQNQILMTKQMGLATDEAAGFQRFSLLTGKSAESIMQSTIKQNTAAISYRKILKEVSTISAELSMRYKNDPEQIAKAVVQANKLGMSLEETRKIASSLLNFEQSIEGELEAELLLERQFNFEKARELALMGKSAEAAGELLSQIDGIKELEKMNVIQRERIAAAIGLSADELSKAAINQEVLTKLGVQNRAALEEQYELYRKSGDQAKLIALQEKARRIEGGDALLQDISRASLNQRFEESINKIKEIFTEIASGPIISILNGMAKMLQHTTVLKGLLIAAAAAMTAIAVSATIASFGAAAAAAAPWVAGIGAAAAGITTAIAVNDSMISPSGQIMISTPQGNILPNKNDSIITTTNPGGLLSGGSDNSAVTAKLDELIGEVRKGGNVYIDSTRSGTAYGMSYNSYA